MAEGTTLVRVIVAIGVIALMATFLYPAGGVPALDNLGALPEFDNPFAPRTFTFTMGDDNTSEALFKPLNVRGDEAVIAGYCDADEFPVDNDWFGCLNSPDQNHTYLTSGFGGFSNGISVDLGGFPDTNSLWRVMDLSVTFQCKSKGSGIQFQFTGPGAQSIGNVGDAPGESSCHRIDTIPDDDFNQAAGYANATLVSTEDLEFAGVFTTGPRGFAEANMLIQNGGAFGEDDLFTISYAAVTVTFQRSADCDFTPSGNPFDDIVRATFYVGCVFQAFFTFLWDAINFAFNFLTFIGAWFVYILTFVVAMVSVVAWLYAIPGMPTFAQVILDVILTALIGFLAFTVIKLLRGSGE